jgi:hypothetical protein
MVARDYTSSVLPRHRCGLRPNSMETLEQLRLELWARWRQQLERSPRGIQKPIDAATAVYATRPIFDLRKYTPPRFKPTGRRTSHPVAATDNRVYWLDMHERPLYTEFRHSYNGVDWRGLYRYAPDEAEYTEWCLQTGVCSQYDRLVFENDQPRSFQRLLINGRGSFPIWRGLNTRRLMDAIESSPNNYSVWIETYDVRDGRIQSGQNYIEGMGSPPLRATLAYTYAGGKLERIVQRWESGEEQTVFAARRPVGLKTLSQELSRRIALRAIEGLRAARIDSPLVALEMNYRSVEAYAPALIPATERDTISSLSLVAAIPPGRWIQLPAEDFEPAMTDFRERLERTGGWQAGTRMLREAARQVTGAARTQLNTMETFVAFAIDWEMEDDDLAAILEECGATPESLHAFRAKGWI